MASLDFNYIEQLVRQAQAGDSDAFAELYMATYPSQYRFACNYLNDVYLAQEAVQETYINALRSISRLRDPSLIIAWLNQINFRVCYSLQHRSSSTQLAQRDTDAGRYAAPENEIIHVGADTFTLRQVMNLPFTESQTVLLRYFRKLSVREISSLLEQTRQETLRCMHNGVDRLRQTGWTAKGGMGT